MKFKLIKKENQMLVRWTGKHNKCIAKVVVAKIVHTKNGYLLEPFPSKNKAWKKLGWELCNLHHYENARLSIFKQI